MARRMNRPLQLSDATCRYVAKHRVAVTFSLFQSIAPLECSMCGLTSKIMHHIQQTIGCQGATRLAEFAGAARFLRAQAKAFFKIEVLGDK